MTLVLIILISLLLVLTIVDIVVTRKGAKARVVRVHSHATRKYDYIPMDQLARKIENATGFERREVLEELHENYDDRLVHKYDGVRSGLPHELADAILANYIAIDKNL